MGLHADNWFFTEACWLIEVLNVSFKMSIMSLELLLYRGFIVDLCIELLVHDLVTAAATRVVAHVPLLMLDSFMSSRVTWTDFFFRITVAPTSMRRGPEAPLSSQIFCMNLLG